MPRRSHDHRLVWIWIFLCWTFAFTSPVLYLSSKIYLLSSFHFKILYNIYTPLYIPEKQVELHPSSQNLVTTQISSLDFVLRLSPLVSRISQDLALTCTLALARFLALARALARSRPLS